MSKRLGALRLAGAIVWVVVFLSAAQAGTVLHRIGSFALPGGGQPFDLAFANDGAFLYVSDTTGKILVLARDAQSGSLSLLQSLPGANQPCVPRRIGLSPDQKNLYVACNYTVVQETTGLLSTFARDLPSGLLTHVSTVGSQPYPESVVVSPDGAHLYAMGTNGGSAQPVVFARDAGTGDLTPIAPSTGSLRGQNDIVFWNSGSSHCTAGAGQDVWFPPLRVERYGTLTQGSRTPLTGALSTTGFLRVPASEGGASMLAIDPGAPVVHATGTGFLVGYGLTQPLSLRYLFAERHQGIAGLLGATDLAVSLDSIVVASQSEDVSAQAGLLVVFGRPASGPPRYVETVGAVPGANAVVVAPDGPHVYAAAMTSASVEIFRDEPVCPPQPRNDCRAATRGVLTFKPTATGASLRFEWQNELTAFPLAGDPWGGSTYSLCLYDEQGGGAVLVGSADAPQGRLTARRGWKRYAEGASVSRYKYRDPFGTPDGVALMDLETQRVRVRAKGRNLAVPSPPFQLPLTAQVGSDFGECWEVRFDTADVRVSDPLTGRLVARYRAN